MPQSLTEKNFTSMDSRGEKSPTCCVAHKAEIMISEVQELCKFGARFGLLVAEDTEVQDCLSFLRTKLREMSQCSGDVLYASSSDGGVD
ncbi:hypothetical protein VP1G_11446 [Cytospora mali]|uniref:Uncharacterized protein n=1 Tax=Cytospora mali TaxID=578113 RepID=A0A194VGD3_CYTMA|nr:hypothetical protein VP1G_11446 [Valsa mali var. pyri (nom. inval.)]